MPAPAPLPPSSTSTQSTASEADNKSTRGSFIQKLVKRMKSAAVRALLLLIPLALVLVNLEVAPVCYCPTVQLPDCPVAYTLETCPAQLAIFKSAFLIAGLYILIRIYSKEKDEEAPIKENKGVQSDTMV